MLVERYPPGDVVALVLKLLAEFRSQRCARWIACSTTTRSFAGYDLARRARHSLSRGRRATRVEAVLRLLVIERLHGWSYEEVERCVAASWCCAHSAACSWSRCPDDTTLLRWANRIAPATLAALNERVIALARVLEVTRRRKLPVGSTVVETVIHRPSHSRLLDGGVRVLSRPPRPTRR